MRVAKTITPQYSTPLVTTEVSKSTIELGVEIMKEFVDYESRQKFSVDSSTRARDRLLYYYVQL